MSEWASRPRATAWTGRRKSTARFCLTCEAWHPTARAVGGEQRCAALDTARAERRQALFAAPHVRIVPAAAAKVVVAGG